MKKTILSLTLLISAPALWAFSPAELAQTLQKPQNVQGNFVQQRQLKSLSKPMTTSGSFTLVPQKGLLWKMQKPFETTLRVRSDGIMQWNGSQWVNPNASKLNGQSRQIQNQKAFVAQGFGHFAIDNTLRQAFNNSGFTHTRLTNQHRVVFGTALQYLNRTTNFIITTDNRVELTVTGALSQVKCVFFKASRWSSAFASFTFCPPRTASIAALIFCSVAPASFKILPVASFC